MTAYFIEEIFYTTHTAGSKPRNDIAKIFKELKLKPLQSNIQKNGWYLNQQDIVFFQYTLFNDRIKKMFEQLYEHKVNTVLIIHDIPSLREGNEVNIQRELNILNQATCLIVHNEEMEQWLNEHGVKTPMYSLSFFDYLIHEEEYKQIKKRTLTNQVIFAGNLNPKLRKFLYDSSFEHQFQFNLYGPEVKGKLENNTTKYFGSFTPEKIPSQLEGSFGLLWNGDTHDTCSGSLGFYSTIIRSHKTSLYLIAGLPIICWEKSSEARIVREEKIGFIIKSLSEIDDKISNLTLEEYETFQRNVAKFSVKLRDGYYLKQVINRILNQMNNINPNCGGN